MSSEHHVAGNVIQVEQDESLPEVLERLRGHRGEPVTLEIADHSPILLTATEFRALKDLADRQQVRLELRTRDALRLQLASMFGLASAPARPEPAEMPHDGEEHHSFGSWRNARRPKHRPAGQPPEPEPEAAVAVEEAKDPIAVSRRRRNPLYADSVARDTPDDFVRIDDAGLDYLDDEEKPSRAWLYGRIAAVALVLLALLGMALWYWMPKVTVDVTLRQADVSTEIVYSVVVPGGQAPSDAAFTAEATEQSADVPFTIEVPATGTEKEPDGTATGALQFRNVGEQPVTLDQGTELTTAAGASYLLLEPVEVPAGTIDAPGEAEGPVTAAQAGAAGNVDAGGLTGKIPDQQVYYSNLGGPIAGGSDTEYAVVTEDDLAEAQRRVKEDLREAAVQGWGTQLPEGMAIVGPSVTPGDPQYTVEGKAGERRESVVVSGTVPVKGYVYSIAEVQQQARATFEQALQDQVPPGYALVPETIELAEPQVLAEAPQNVDYRVRATAVARAVFDEGAQQGLRERMAGSSVEGAEAALNDVGAIESWQISHAPGWWPNRMPQGAGRIELDIRAAGAGGAGAPASPEATPEPAS
jgi:hypothetical protein